MNTSQSHLNLARKWRPQTFDQIIGQDIPVRMLKNSIYLKKLFPVYLFAGQRGCGKTTSARVFAAAVNCAALPAFQENPQIAIPCLQCESCIAMIQGHHPDFIEIDAASHTGVDHVRQIIESSSYMPLLGAKKIYLIDEAHMLSKAAFNAFLKILEEPPASVIFILATTETQKIPATVLSRCFQLTFNPIRHEHLKNHLRTLCTNEQITIDDNAIDLIIAETEGSARDAINLLERVRFSGESITQDTVLRVLGKISNQTLFALFELLLAQNAAALLVFLHDINFENISPHMLWDMLISLCRMLLWKKYQVSSLTAPFNNSPELTQLAEQCSINRLHAIFQLLWSQETLFIATTKKHAFLEMVLLQICEQVNIASLEELLKIHHSEARSTNVRTPQPAPRQATTIVNTSPHGTPAGFVQKATFAPTKNPAPALTQQEAKPVELLPAATQQESPIPSDPLHAAWHTLRNRICEGNDLLLGSIIMQATFLGPDEEKKKLRIQLSNNGAFFKDKLEESKAYLIPLLTELFPGYTWFDYALGATPPPARPHPIESPHHNPPASSPPIVSQTTPSPQKNITLYKKTFTASNPSSSILSDPIDVSDKTTWPMTNLLMSHFPGKIRRVKLYK